MDNILSKAKIKIWDNRFLLLALLAWFLGGFSVYFFLLGFDLSEAVRATFFFSERMNDFSAGYNMWSQGIIFGVVFTFISQNLIEKYNPERGCRLMAKKMKDHLIVVGYSHLGERLVSFLREKKYPYCLIEKEKEKVDNLLEEGEPVIVDDATEKKVLADAGISQAKAIVITANNLEAILIVTKRARDFNKDCYIVTRCFQDELTEIVESLGANKVISSSKEAFENILDILKKGKININHN